MGHPDASTPTRSDPAAIAAQNDAFRRLACLGTPPDQAMPGRMHVTRALIEAGDGFVTEAVQAVGAFDTFEPENDPEGWHDFGAVEIRGETCSGRSTSMKLTLTSAMARRRRMIPQPPCAC